VDVRVTVCSYFEVTVSSSTPATTFSVGWVPGAKLGFTKMLGDGGYTMGYHSTGECLNSGFPTSKKISDGDVIGVGWCVVSASRCSCRCDRAGVSLRAPLPLPTFS
jgi:hypothetical protein